MSFNPQDYKDYFLDGVGLAKLITLIKEKFQLKMHFDNFFKPQDPSTEEPIEHSSRPSNIALVSAFNFGLKGEGAPTFFPENPNLKFGVIRFGQQLCPTSNYGVNAINGNSIVIDTDFGVIRKVLTKQEYETAKASTGNYPDNIVNDANLFHKTTSGNSKHLLSLVVTQEYDDTISSSPLRVVPFYKEVNGENVLKGFWCIHDSSNAVKGYYVAMFADQIYQSANV